MYGLKVSRHLIGLSPLAEDDLEFVSRKMDVDESIAVRQALRFLARHVAEVEQEAKPVLEALNDSQP